jgi:type II secretory pathway pseudopilin PulG
MNANWLERKLMYRYLPDFQQRSASGFTLVELLITSTLLVVVVGAVGTVLVSELNSTNNLQRSIGQSEDIARVRSQLQREVALADRLSNSTSDLPNGCSVRAPLILIGPGNGWRIAYGLRSQGPNTSWRGPNQLLRCGPPYDRARFNPAGAAIQSVVADGVPDGGLTTTVSGTANSINRSVQIGITVTAPGGHSSSTTSFLAHVDTNRPNNFINRPDLADVPKSEEVSRVRDKEIEYTHWKATGGSIAGEDDRFDIIYFANPISSYTISSGCSRVSCSVTSAVTGSPAATITKGDALVFGDQEIRLR